MRSFDAKWEETYSTSSSKHLNKYPYGQLVTYFFRNLKHLPAIKSGETPRILELGCGVGNNMQLIIAEGFKAFGIDGSDSAIKLAKDKYAQATNAEFTVGDFLALPYQDGYFDMIIDRQSIYANKYADIKNIFHQVQRVLKKGGVLISFLYNRADYHYLRAMSEPGFAAQIEDGTFDSFRSGTFEGNGVAHFFTLQEVNELVGSAQLSILSLSENKIEQVLPEPGNKLAEFILVAQK